MTSLVKVSGLAGEVALNDIAGLIKHGKPKVVAIASAFVSVRGVENLTALLKKAGHQRCRLIAGIDHEITHPRALLLARELGWELRLGSAPSGIFHPKLFVGGRAFTREGGIRNVSCVYVGSSNLTASGLTKSVECGVFENGDDCGQSASDAFALLWENARPATNASLTNYASLFAETSRGRSPATLKALGVADTEDTPDQVIDARQLLARTTPQEHTVDSEFATTAWAGLQSYTGEYQFQVEFPRDAGKVIRRLLDMRHVREGLVDVFCSADRQTRPMRYAFYKSNGMFRLNIPNEVPGVDWARQHRDGIAVVEAGPSGGAALRLRILRPGAETSEVVSKAVALNTWGRTPTRAYGWF